MKCWMHVLWLGLLLSSEVAASPFWCGGDDRFADHPLDINVIGEELNDISSLPELYQTIRSRFISHVNDIGEQDEENVQIVLGMFYDLLNPASSSFLRHTQFRWNDAELRGLELLGCELIAEEVQIQRPGLAAAYAAIETTFLAGRQANSMNIETNAAVIRKEWMEEWEEAATAAADAANSLNNELLVNPLIGRLSTAPAAYNRLTELWYRKPETVVYRVDLSSATGPNLPTALEGEHVTVEIPVTPNVSVELTGSAGLDIEPKGKIKKRVSDAAPTSWEWKVTPVDTDDQFLILTTYVHISEDEDSEPHTIKSYEDVIRVNVKLWDHLATVVSTVQPVWAFAGIVVAGLVGAYGWYRRKGWRAPKKPVLKIQGIRRVSRKSWWKGRQR